MSVVCCCFVNNAEKLQPPRHVAGNCHPQRLALPPSSRRAQPQPPLTAVGLREDLLAQENYSQEYPIENESVHLHRVQAAQLLYLCSNGFVHTLGCRCSAYSVSHP